jgi:hypothetical protein
MKTLFTLIFTMLLLGANAWAQTAEVADESQFLSAIANGSVATIELQNDFTLASAVTIERTVTIKSKAPHLFTLTFTAGEMMIRNQMTPITVTLEDLGIILRDPDVLRPYGIKHMTGKLIAENLVMLLECGDGGFQPGLAPSGIYLHVGTESLINGSVIMVDNDYTGATYGVYFTAQGNHTVTNTLFDLKSLGTYRFAFGTQNVTGPPAGPFLLADFPALTLTGNSSAGATHSMMVYLQDGESNTQLDQAKAIIDYVIDNNGGGPVKNNGLPPIGQIRGQDGIITDYPLAPAPVPISGWMVFSIFGVCAAFVLIRKTL